MSSGIINSMLNNGYPGNPELPEATKFRIESSFRQALSLFLNGNLDDCIMGCDFILKLDPQFEPAKILMAKAQNPKEEIDLREIIKRYGEAEEINVEELLIEAIEFYNQREFEKTIAVLNKVLLKDPENNEAKEIFERTKEKLELQAFVLQFVKKAKDYLQEGSLDDALREINKGLALDEINPELLELKREVERAKEKLEKVQVQKEEIEKEEVISSFQLEAQPETSFQLESQDIKGELVEEIPQTSPPPEELIPEEPSSQVSEIERISLEPSVEIAKDVSVHQKKINSLLDEGLRSFQLGEYQEAIDIWSRIFLIDMDNEEALKRIEEAKVKLAEEERKIEELFSLALSYLQQGKKEEAKKVFHDILAKEPHHLGARNHLRQLEEEEKEKEIPQVKMEEKPLTIEEILPEIPKVEEVTIEKPPKKKIFLPIAIATFIVLIIVAGWFLMEGEKKKPIGPNPAILLSNAKSFISEKNWEEALKELTKIQPDSKEYGEALALISKVKQAMAEKKKEMIDGKPIDVVFEEYKQIAYDAFKEKDYAKAEEYYKKAEELKPLSIEEKAYLEDVSRVMAEINSAKSYADSGNFEQAISLIDPIYKEDKIIQAKELLVLSNYNLGIKKLKEENMDEAYKYFKAVLNIDPEDEAAKKNVRFIERYKEARKDLLYQIYIKYITAR